MTITNTVASTTSAGNDVQTLWPYNFNIPDAASVIVTVIDPSGVETVISSGSYSITGLGTGSGTVTYPTSGAPLASGYSIRIDRSTALTQNTGYGNQSGLINSLIEVGMDKLTMIAQDTQTIARRAMSAAQNILSYAAASASNAAAAAASATAAAGSAASAEAAAVDATAAAALVNLVDGAITTAKLAASAVTTAKIASQAVDPSKLALGAWTSIASAATIDLGAQTTRNVVITGAAAIASFGSTPTLDAVPFHVRFSGALTLTRSAALETPSGANITTAPNDSAIIVQETTGYWRIVSFQRGAVTGTPGALYGLTTAYVSATTYSVGAGSATSEDGSAYPMVLAATMTKSLSAWSAGSGAGSLDTGTIAAGTSYHLHLIGNPTTGATDILLSLSPSAPTMPTGWVGRRRIASCMTNASAQLVAWKQFGDEFLLLDQVRDYLAAPQTTSPVLQHVTVPTGVNFEAMLTVGISSGTTPGVAVCINSPEVNAPSVPTANTTASLGTGTLTIGAIMAMGGWPMTSLRVRTNTAANVRRTMSAAGASDILLIQTAGWVDTRGRI